MKIVAKQQQDVRDATGVAVGPDESHSTTASLVFDAVFLPSADKAGAALTGQGDATHFIRQAFRHWKPIAASSAGVGFLESTMIRGIQLAGDGAAPTDDRDVVTSRSSDHAVLARRFLAAVAMHRFWDGPMKDSVPA